MPPLPQPGDYRTTGLPDDYTLFSAWMFLNINSDAQPPVYRQGRSLALARTLMEAGETSPDLLGAALLSLMPPELHSQIARRVNPAIAATVADFTRHIMTHFAYIDQAAPDAQKITLAMLGNTVLHQMKTGDATLKRLQESTQGDTQEPAASLLADPRNFLLIAGKTNATLGDSPLHEVFTKSALAYQRYRHDYLFTIVAMTSMPQRLRAAAAMTLEPTPDLPAFNATALPDTPEVYAVYKQLANDPRVNMGAFATALDIGETLANCPDVAPATLTAAMICNAIPHIGTPDMPFLRALGGDECASLIEDSTRSMKQPVSAVAVPLRQMAAARAISTLKSTTFKAARMHANLLARQGSIPSDQIRHIVETVVTPASDSLNDIITGLLPHAASLHSAALTGQLRQHVGQATVAIDQLVEMTARHETAPPKPRNDGPAL